MKRKQYYSININELTIDSLTPLRFKHTLKKEKVPFYQSGMFGRLITVEGKNPTNTLEEAEAWLTNLAERNSNPELLLQEAVPYIDMNTITPLNEQQTNQMKNQKVKTRFGKLSK